MLNCTNSTEEKQFQPEYSRSQINRQVDTTAIQKLASDAENPILAKLESEYDWEFEKHKWQRNPFKPYKPRVKMEAPKKRRRIVINEAAGLKLNGIIQVKNKRKALINGKIYTVGSSIRNLRIKSINKNSVILKSKVRTYILVLKE
ncbi:hypothetical protein GF337_11695 [candidate division KSB1 bacterium]|nr:hypothetical protein [candidate division KSB1 bacterium]